MNDTPAEPGAMSPTEWNDCYTGSPHWDTGGPQPAFLDLAEAGAIAGSVLDAGCGTGEHVLMSAARGLDATGVDVAPAAVAAARGKADARGLVARFLVRDAHDLTGLGPFDTVLDSGLLHIFTDTDREGYLRGIRSVLVPGGRMFVLCFSDQQPAPGGPRRLSRDDVIAAFADGWRIDAIEPTTLDTADGRSISGWLVRSTRLPDPVAADATVPTTRAQRYLDQFCRHAEQVHRIDHPARDHGGGPAGRVTVRRADGQTTVDFGWGRCTLRAEADALILHAEAADADSLRRVQTIVGADLDRFARRENVTVTWQQDPLPEVSADRSPEAAG